MLTDDARPAPADAAPVATTGYEFNEHEEQVFSSTVFWLQVIIITSALTGAVQLWNALSASETSPLVLLVATAPAAVSFVIAGALWRCQQGFKKLARTEGNDIHHLLDALRGLRVFFFILAATVTLQALVVGSAVISSL